MEHFAIVVKMFGPTCQVKLNDDSTLLCHIRNKFKGRHKSGNFIAVGSILLIGFREWESITDRKNCDLLFVYDSLQTQALSDVYTLPVSETSTKDISEILFSDAIENENMELGGGVEEEEANKLSDIDFDDL
jgi:hypothetical protein